MKLFVALLALGFVASAYSMCKDQDDALGKLCRGTCKQMASSCGKVISCGNDNVNIDEYCPTTCKVRKCKDCSDTDRRCRYWKSYFCKTNLWVRTRCKKTCDLCGPVTQAPTQGPWTGPTIAPAQCGQPQVQMSRVIAGEDAKRGAWPWQILMLKNGSPGCGGSLINSKWVVTAAHCVHRSENHPFLFDVRVGEHDRNKNEGSEVDMQVERVVKHPSYNPRNLDNDIALFKLAKPVMMNKYVQPVCLPSANLKAGHECYITGWGKIRHPGSMHSYLQQAKMPIVTNDACHKKNFPAIRIPVTKTMICGGDGGKTRISGCHGDSGGPYVCKVGSKWELHGDVSHGSPRCSSSQTYTVFARTFFFKDWIHQMVHKYGM